MRHATLGLALAVVLVLTLAGCSGGCARDESAAPRTPPPGSGPAPSTQTVTGWIVGRWRVEFELVSVDPDADWARKAADQPKAEWSCTIDGSAMWLDAGRHLYDGRLTPGEGDEWTYEGTATYTDDSGSWTSDITVEGVREGPDSFSGEQRGTISSAEGTLYAAVWRVAGTRLP